MTQEKPRVEQLEEDSSSTLQQIVEKFKRVEAPLSIVYRRQVYTDFLYAFKQINCIIDTQSAFDVIKGDAVSSVNENIKILTYIYNIQQKLCSSYLFLIQYLIDFENECFGIIQQDTSIQELDSTLAMLTVLRK